MKRTFLVLFSVITLLSVNVLPVSAQFTLLPKAPEGVDCKSLLNEYELTRKIIVPKQKIADSKAAEASKNYTDYLATLDLADFGDCTTGTSGNSVNNAKCDELKKASDQAQADAANAQDEAYSGTELLGCAIKTGKVSLQMVPHFISFFANFLLSLSGLISVLFIVIGGFMYIYGGLTDQKERGKKYIYHALMGMVLALMAWTIVSVIMVALTS